ncbi:ABC transporter permease subunit [Ruminococcus sp. OA3]|uniref:ABC transporter permease/substrate-binding protein n=1 Tax=Ruminococcus sp. OA3 TaxID=2914164 RepID=UPI001F066399|nr:glycine betaine ABC transporter substrate-binding protein [Ruminococcus sp. OA3]MCH1983563.1 ABC transporter permease subunit [Ruminococcus sp. OA3]
MLNDICTLVLERRGFFLQLLWEHLEISFISIVIAVLAGGLAGILISEYEKAAKPTLAAINFLYTIPSISMLGFLIPFSGVGNTTAVIALTVYALLPMVRAVHTGIRNVDRGILEAARGMGSTDVQILYKIKIPLALPVIMSGIRNMVTMTIALAGIASFIGAGGLGVAIYRGITTNNAAMTIAGSLFIALLALLMDLLLGILEKSMERKNSGIKRRNLAAKFVIGISCAAVLGGILWNTHQEDVIRIATKPMTEQYILGEMLDILIEQDTDLKVELTQGVGGGTSNIWPAMESGEFDIYPEYTGTAWNMVLKEEGGYSEDMFGELEDAYKETYDMNWKGMYGFNNTYGLAVRKEIADQYSLKTYSDLEEMADQLVFGAEYDFFEREDGYDALCDAYGLKFKSTMDLDIGLKYKAIQEGKIDVMVIFTTDGQLSASDVAVLTDDQGFYPSYMCGNIVRSEVMEDYPELEAVFEKLTGVLNDAQVSHLNYEVEAEGKEPRDAAIEFLEETGLLKGVGA